MEKLSPSFLSFLSFFLSPLLPLSLSRSSHCVALLRYAIRSVRSWGFLSPAKTILVPVFFFLKKEEEEVERERTKKNEKRKVKKELFFSFSPSFTLLPGMYFFGLRR